MKILVIDDEHSFGALLGHTLKRLGHKPVIAVHPEDALELLTPDVDAVITDIDMPVMNGVELAREIRARLPEMPVAFCTGSAPGGQIVSEAQEIGRVLPKVWTVADVKQVVHELKSSKRTEQPARHRRRRSSVAHLYEEAARAESEPTPAPPSSRKPRRMRVSFKTWDQVRQLTSKLERGPARVTVPGPATLVPTDPVAISFVLPQEITVRIAGEVHAVRPRDGARPDVVIELVGLTADVAARLNALADAGDPAPAPRRPTGYLQVSPRLDARTRPARGSDPALARGSEQGLRVSEILRNNQRLRTQIEGLASKMTPRPETDD